MLWDERETLCSSFCFLHKLIKEKLFKADATYTPIKIKNAISGTMRLAYG